jgi:hypothetical protein
MSIIFLNLYIIFNGFPEFQPHNVLAGVFANSTAIARSILIESRRLPNGRSPVSTTRG